MRFQLSENESNILGYRVARGNLDTITNSAELKQDLLSERIDVLKLNIENSPSDLYTLLDELALPYYVLGIVVTYISNFRKNPVKEYLHESIEFEEYLGENSDQFVELVSQIFQQSPASYFINPGLLDVYNKERQVQCLANYVSTLHRASQSHCYAHLVKYKGELAGFITSYKEGEGGAATYAGLLPKFVGKGLYLDLVSFIQNHGKAIGQKWGKAYVQLQNTVVQKTYQRQGLRPDGYLLNVHVNCCFGELKNRDKQ